MPASSVPTLPERSEPPERPTTERPAPSERKEEIYRVAAQLFSDKGYHATSMRDIAGALSLKAGSLYSHIEGKEELLWGIICRIADEFDQALLPAKDHLRPAPARLHQAISAYIGVVSRNMEYSAVLLSEWRHLGPQRQALVTARRDAVERVFRGIIRDGVVAGDFAPQTDIKLTAVLALSAANGLPNWFKAGGQLSEQDVVQEFARIVLSGIVLSSAALDGVVLDGIAPQPEGAPT